MINKFIRKLIRFLEILYYNSDKKGIGREEFKKLRLTNEEFNKIIEYCKDRNLIKVKRKDTSSSKYRIKTRGIEFLINQRNLEAQREFSKIVALTGSILALIGIYNFFVALNLIKSFNFITLIFLISIFLAIGPIVSYLFRIYFGGG